MAAVVTPLPLIVITGPTASGKTEVAIRLAKEWDGEIICADSRTVYRGLDIGTAKPTVAERDRVVHHLLDVAAPDEAYDVARFQHDARMTIDAIRSRGKVPFLVGGSGLYIDSIVLDYQLGPPADPRLRASLEAMGMEELFEYCFKNNIVLPNNKYNKRYVIRAIEQNGVNNKKRERPADSTIVIAIKTDVATLKQRIQRRAEHIFENGIVQEVEMAIARYGSAIAPLQAPAYKAARGLLDNEMTKEEAIASLAHDDWQLARKQLTWLRRHPWVQWLELNQVEPYVRSILAQQELATAER